jgi:hypothetical protein
MKEFTEIFSNFLTNMRSYVVQEYVTHTKCESSDSRLFFAALNYHIFVTLIMHKISVTINITH